MAAGPDPDKIATRSDFARELSFLKDRAGLSVRGISRACNRSDATVGDYFSGAHLPRPDSFRPILGVLGITDLDEVDRWLRALARVRAGRRRGDRPEPYRGLAAYQIEDAPWFQGRDRLVDLIVRRLADVSAGPGRLLIIIGPSGSGKSSLLRAGLVPRLRTAGFGPAGSRDWPVHLVTPGEQPGDALGKLAVRAQGRPCVVVIDQFEEIFTACTDSIQRRDFVDSVCRSGTGPLDGAVPAGDLDAVFVVGLRADFYAQALRHPAFARAAQQAQVVVEPMTRAEVASAIVQPARQAGIEVEEGLVELLLRDLAPADRMVGSAHDAGALPLLSHALLTTWRHAAGRTMTVAAYLACGGIDGAVARTADEVVSGLEVDRRELARRLFLRLVYVGDEAVTRRRIRRDDLVDPDAADVDDLSDLIDDLVDARLLTAGHDTLELAHEALVWAWPQLREWIDADRAGLRAARHLTDAAEQWEREGREPAALYRDGRLGSIRDWVEAGGRSVLSTTAAAFYDQSMAMQQRRTRRVYQVLAAFVVLTMLAAITGIVAVKQRGAAAAERDLALSRAIAIQADRVRDTDVALAAQLSLAAYRIAPTADALSALLNTSATATATRIVGPAGIVHAVGVSTVRHILGTGNADGTVRLWDIADPHQPVSLGPPNAVVSSPVTALAVSPSGLTMAAGGTDHTIRLLDIADPQRPRPIGAPLTGPSDVVNSVAFSGDGAILAAGSADARIWLWRVDDLHRPTQLRPPLTNDAPVNAVAFSPTGHLFAAGGADGTVRLWDSSNPVAYQALTATAGRSVNAIAFSPDGRTLAAGGTDNTVHRWNLTARHRADPADHPLTGPASWIYGVAFSLDGRQLAAGSADDAARVWDLATGRLAATLPHPGPVTAVAYAADRRTLVTGGADGVTRLWTLPTPILTTTNSSVFTVAFSPDGTELVAAAGDGSLHRWSLADPWSPAPADRVIAAPTGKSALDGTVAYGTGGRLAAGDVSGGVELWTAGDTHAVRASPPANGLTGAVQYVAFSPDGRTLAAGNDQGGVQLWDVTDALQPRPLATMRTVHNVATLSVAFNNNATVLAGASADNTVWLWDTTHKNSPYVLHPPLTGPTNAVYHVVFSPDGNYLAAGSADGSVHLWDMAVPSRPAPLGPPLTGPKGYVYAVAFTPDGRTLATANTDRSIWLWSLADPHNAHRLAVLAGPAKTVFTVAISPDGALLAAGGLDQTVRIWHLDPQAVAGWVCASAGSPVNTVEWTQYVGETPYEPSC